MGSQNKSRGRGLDFKAQHVNGTKENRSLKTG